MNFSKFINILKHFSNTIVVGIYLLSISTLWHDFCI